MSKRLKNWFFQVTATAIKTGTRYLDGDKPPSATFQDHLESSVFKTESEDRAKEDEGGFDPDKNGHVTMASDLQVIAYADKPVNRSLATQPSQLTEVDKGSDITICDFEGPSVSVTKDVNETRRNKYLVNISTELAQWLENIANTSDKYLAGITSTITESLEPNVNIVVVIDTSSLDVYGTTIETEMTAWYNAFTSANPWYQGELKFYYDEDELWLSWPKLYGSNYNENEMLMIAFIDESQGLTGSTGYHGGTVSVISTEVPTTRYKSDFDEFVTSIYPSFTFFKGLIYAVPAGLEGNPYSPNAVFHSHIYKAITDGLVPAINFIESPTVVSFGSTLDFITSFNAYTNTTGSAAPSGTYDGLVNYGWAEYHDFDPDDINTKLTREEFDDRIQTALFGEGKTNTVTIDIVATMNDNEEISTDFQINIPVAQIPFEQYKNLPNPTSTADIDLYADGTLYYMTVAQVWGSGNAPDGGAIMTDDHKILFVKD